MLRRANPACAPELRAGRAPAGGCPSCGSDGWRDGNDARPGDLIAAEVNCEIPGSVRFVRVGFAILNGTDSEEPFCFSLWHAVACITRSVMSTAGEVTIEGMTHRSPPAKLDLIATSTFGLEAVVARELQSLGYEAKIIQPGRVLFAGDESDICRTNLWLRTADRVLVRLDTFEARDFGQLFDRTRALPWEDWLAVEAEFPVTGRSVKSQLSSVPACQKIVKKAVVERLKAAYGVEWFAETGPKYSLEVALLNDQAMLTIDTSGPGLHKRGYRPLTGKAPLKETLAAALVLLSVWRPERPLIDPFCGSGTIPIEAALIGRNMAPGLGRTYCGRGLAPRAGGVVGSGPAAGPRGGQARSARPDVPGARIIGTDVDEGVLGLARFHAEKAGVAADIHFQQRTFAELSSKRPYGCVICNPPYGERLGQSAEALALHRAMPDVFRRLKTWSFFILTALPDFEAVVGQSATRRRKLYNGRIECTYYQFLGPKPGAGSRKPKAESRNKCESEIGMTERMRPWRRVPKRKPKSEDRNGQAVWRNRSRPKNEIRDDGNRFEHSCLRPWNLSRLSTSPLSALPRLPAPALPASRSSAVSRPRPGSRPRSSGHD